MKALLIRKQNYVEADGVHCHACTHTLHIQSYRHTYTKINK